MLEFLDEDEDFRGKLARKEPKSAASRSRSRGQTRGNFGGAGHQLAPQYQRVVVKIHSTRVNQAGMLRLKAHAKYLARDGVGREDEPAKTFGKDDESVDLSEFVRRCDGDRHIFRVILSPEFGEELDLETYTRDVMQQAEKDLRTRLEWAAVCHYNTDNPHAHILIRGVDGRGNDLFITPDYLTRGLRQRAREVATYHLGPRTPEQVQRAEIREISAQRFTSLDRELLNRATPAPQEQHHLLDLRVRASQVKPEALRRRNRLLKRVEALESMGLARPVARNQWHLPASLEGNLRDLALQKDIIRRMYAARRTEPGRWASPQDSRGSLTGRLVARGLSDDHHGHEYLIIEATDGRVHHIERAHDADSAARAEVGDVVALARSGAQTPVLTRLAGPDLRALAAYDGPVWLDRCLVENRHLSAQTGFAAELRRAMAARRRTLESMGVVAPGEDIPPQILKTMRARERTNYVQAYARKAKKSVLAHTSGASIDGKISPPIKLSGGTYHLVESSHCVLLLPSEQTLKKHAGQDAHVTIKVAKDGRLRPHVRPINLNKGLER